MASNEVISVPKKCDSHVIVHQAVWATTLTLKPKEKKKKNDEDYYIRFSKFSKYVPTGMNVKSAILFSIALMILSRPLGRNVPELVRTLKTTKNRPFKRLDGKKQQKDQINNY